MPFWRRIGERAEPDWLGAAVRFYRGLGFFEEVQVYRDGSFEAAKGLTEPEVRAALAAAIKGEHGGPLDPADPSSDLHLLELDPDRVWWEDLEADVAGGNHVYADALADLARISRGVLAIGAIRESWDGEEGPVRIDFTLRGEPRRIEPEYQDDWMDLRFFRELARFFEGTPFRLCWVDTEGQDLFLTVLTEAERAVIRKERDLAFESL